MYREVQKIVNQENPIIPLYSAVGVDLWNRSVEGLRSVDALTGTMTSVENAWLNR